MEPKTTSVFLISLLLVSMVPALVTAEDSGGVQSSAAQLSLSPTEPVVGGSVDFSVTLYNSQPTWANGVSVEFYKENIGGATLYFNQIDIPPQSFYTVNATWSGLAEGNRTVWIEFSANGDAQARFSKEFYVQGLANLRVDTLEVGASGPVYSGDVVPLSALVLNSGSVDAAETKLLLQVPESPDVLLTTPALTAGSSAWVNTTITAPSSGVHLVQASPDAENLVEEASEMNKMTDVELVVATRMDLEFEGGLTITSVEGELEGPWTVEGTLVRTNGTGSAQIPLWLQMDNPSGGLVTSAPFLVNFTGVGFGQQTFSTELTSSTLASLPDGDHIVTAVINPFNEPGLQQERTDNDRTSGVLTIYPIPDVYVDSLALPKTPSVQSGDDIEWRITVENTGDVEVSGVIQYTFEGDEGQSPNIRLKPQGQLGSTFVWNVSLPTAFGAHIAEFEGQWVAAPGSWDANKQNSYATGTVLVESKLKLDWELASLVVLDVDNNVPTMPLADGEVYTLSISLTSQETGEANYTCQDAGNTVLSTMAVNVQNRGDRAELSCTFTATAAMSSIRLIPEDTSISTTFSRSFATLASNSGDDGAGAGSESGTVALFGAVALALIGALVVAVILTRERDEEVERDIYEYCPACDGELEGTEDRCPHCVFNLKKARNQFHDCNECGESIPDLLENCVYCGAPQDVSSYFEQRERRERREVVKEEVALPVDDEDEIVTGTQNFADTVKEFGFDEEHLEEEWDANIEAAEAEVEAAYDRRFADEMAMEEMTDEEIEEFKEQVTTTLRSPAVSSDKGIDSILSEKGELKSLEQETGELSASDAAIREQLFEITGEEGVLPGDKVNVGMGMTDSSLAGNEVEEAKANFAFDDDDDDVLLSASVNTGKAPASKGKKPVRRRPSRQAKKDDAPQADECGACGADLPSDALECGTCGAKFG